MSAPTAAATTARRMVAVEAMTLVPADNPERPKLKRARLEEDLCQSPHWGYLIEGEITVNYKDGSEETVTGGDLFYWPPGHTVKAGKDAEIILFSPQAEHCAVVDHVHSQVGG